VRGDSHWNVPEPELSLVLNPEMQIVGFTVGNDVSSRDIEGENPLYLPQAKVYRHSCILGPAITLAGTSPTGEAIDGTGLDIHLQIVRGGAVIFEGATNTSQMNRTLDELAEYLGRYHDFPDGAVLMTGTSIVPGDEFTLHEGDEVTIEIEGIGVLSNPVKVMSQ
jgi:2-dehydro-3-deoxy-D-arabinonate dehydratase